MVRRGHIPAPAVPGAGNATQTEVVRRRWPEVLETVKGLRRVTWALIDPRNAQVADLDATTLRIAFDNPALATTFRNGAHADVVARAVRETLGFDVRVEGILAEQARLRLRWRGRPPDRSTTVRTLVRSPPPRPRPPGTTSRRLRSLR